jgi:uncharacterized repeat protein (TIGR04052 family)
LLLKKTTVKGNTMFQLEKPLIVTAIAFFAIVGCDDDDNDASSDTTSQNVTVQFAATVNDSPFVCGETYSGVSKTLPDSYKVDDFRLYLHDVALVKSDGQKVSVNLTQDGKWQYQNVAMLDFENGCLNGTSEMNSQIMGTLTNDGSAYQGICFKLGVPFELNHINDATANSPLNMSGMLWSWTTGRKFVRIDGIGDPEGINQSYLVHLGSTGCVDSDSSGGEPDGPCTYPNMPEICFDNFDVTKDIITADAGALLKEANLTYNTPDTSAGCMSGNNDPECIDVMPQFGIDFVYNDGVNPPITYPKQQTFFHQ